VRPRAAMLRPALGTFAAWLWAAVCTLAAWIWRLWVHHKRRVILSDWQELEFAPRELQSELRTVQRAVKQDWRALEFASEELRGDRRLVEEAVAQNWRALRFAAGSLRADRELILRAVRDSSGWALEFAAEDLYRDPDLVREATSRLGGRLGLPLPPVATVVPLESAEEEEPPEGEAAPSTPSASDGEEPSEPRGDEAAAPGPSAEPPPEPCAVHATHLPAASGSPEEDLFVLLASAPTSWATALSFC